MNENIVKRPALIYFLTELIRGFWDRLGSLSYRWSFASEDLNDNHPVLIIPGLLSGDYSTRPLRKILQKMGYAVYGWELGMNMAKLTDLVQLEKHMIEIYHKHQHPVNIIGWSLGGIYARKIAGDHPEMTKQIITLGSPYQDLNAPSWAEFTVKLLWGSKELKFPEEHQEWIDRLGDPRPVPTTSIYSKQDGIVPWACCIEDVEDHWHQNIEVKSSHTSMIANLDVLKICVDRVSLDLSQRNTYFEK